MKNSQYKKVVKAKQKVKKWLIPKSRSQPKK